MLVRLISVVLLVVGIAGRTDASSEHIFGWITKLSPNTIELSTDYKRPQTHVVTFNDRTQFMMLTLQKPVRRTPTNAESLRVGQRVWIDLTSDDPPKAIVVKIAPNY